MNLSGHTKTHPLQQVSMSLVAHAVPQDPLLTSQQYLILGSVGSAFKMIAGIPKLSFLQFRGCIFVQGLVLIVEGVCIFVLQIPFNLIIVWLVLSTFLSAFVRNLTWFFALTVSAACLSMSARSLPIF